MKAKVQICYEDESKNKEIEIDGLKPKLSGIQLMNVLDRAIEKKLKDDPDWKRWNLLGIEL